MSLEELESIAARARVHELCDELNVYSPAVRADMLAEPARAIAVLEHAAESAPSLRSPAGYAIAIFRKGIMPGPGTPTLLDQLKPLTPEELEQALAEANKLRERGELPAIAIRCTEAALAIARERGHWGHFTKGDVLRFGLEEALDPDALT